MISLRIFFSFITPSLLYSFFSFFLSSSLPLLPPFHSGISEHTNSMAESDGREINTQRAIIVRVSLALLGV